jgi:hypothetical protein
LTTAFNLVYLYRKFVLKHLERRRTVMGTTQVKRQSLPAEYDVEGDELYTTRMPGSARRYRSTVPAQQDDEPVIQKGTLIQRRRSSLSPKNTHGIASSAIAPAREEATYKPQRFPLVAVLIGMIIMIVLVMSFSALSSWWHVYQDDLHYGRPRTSQMDAVVGHNDSAANPTHFIFLNLNRHVEIIEIPGGDVTHTRIFTGPVLFGNGQDLTPVTGQIRDVNGDGKPDLIAHIQDQQIVFINDGTTFHPQ